MWGLYYKKLISAKRNSRKIFQAFARENKVTRKTIYSIWLIPLKLKKRLLLRCIHHFKSDIINDMDHMRISGTEPSSVILSKTK